MSNMKSLLAMSIMMAGLAYGDNGMPLRNDETSETDEEKKQRLAKAEIERYKAQGMKEYFYGVNSVWAINQKNADKKARKKHWL